MQTTDGNGNVTNIAYTDGLLQSTVTTTPALGPTTKVVSNLGLGTVTTEATRLTTPTVDSPAGTVQMATISESWLDFAGRTLMTKTYAGVLSNQVYTTETRYDDMGRAYYSSDAVGTITQTQFDGLGRPTNIWVGTSGTLGSSNSNLVKVESEQYDNNAVGDGDLTWTAEYTGVATATAPNRVTGSYYDWRGRLVAQNNSLQITFNTLDNLGEVTESERLPIPSQ